MADLFFIDFFSKMFDLVSGLQQVLPAVRSPGHLHRTFLQSKREVIKRTVFWIILFFSRKTGTGISFVILSYFLGSFWPNLDPDPQNTAFFSHGTYLIHLK
jgi:hypothetical protein